MFKLSNFYKGKKILVTGITGFKGAWLAAWLIQLGGIVYGIGFQSNQNKKLFYNLNLKKKVKLSFFDIRSYTEVRKLINKAKPEIIFYLAAQTLIYESNKNPYNTFDINFKGTLNIIDIAVGDKERRRRLKRPAEHSLSAAVETLRLTNSLILTESPAAVVIGNHSTGLTRQRIG